MMDWCAEICKCFLILCNILVTLVGFGIVYLGMWFQMVTAAIFYSLDPNIVNERPYTIGEKVLYITGTLMILVASIGIRGASKQSKFALNVFSGLVSFLIIIIIVAGVMAFTWSGQVSEELVKLYKTIYTSREEKGLKLFHNTFDCCGIDGQIEESVHYTCPEGYFLKQFTFPSCPSVIPDTINSKAPLMLGGFLGMAGIMMVVLVCSIFLSRHIPQSYASPSENAASSDENNMMQQIVQFCCDLRKVI